MIVELGESVFDYTRELGVDDFITVTSDFAGRPWNIAMALYKSEALLAPLFFFNGYSNPYSVAEGDRILVFNAEDMLATIKDLSRTEKELYNSQVTDFNKQNRESKLPKVDENRTKVLERIKGAKPVTESPNQSDGAPAQVPADGVITLGTDVSSKRCKDGLSDTQSRTELIRQTVLNKILGNEK